jgi:hypothetical protein
MPSRCDTWFCSPQTCKEENSERAQYRGKLYRVCFGSESVAAPNGTPTPWIHKSIDSRDCSLPNKMLIAEWIETYGEDSDFVRVRGLPPTRCSSSTPTNRRRSTMRRVPEPDRNGDGLGVEIREDIGINVLKFLWRYTSPGTAVSNDTFCWQFVH